MINKLKNFVDGAARIVSSENWDEGRAQEFISELAELKSEFDKYIKDVGIEEQSKRFQNKKCEDYFKGNRFDETLFSEVWKNLKQIADQKTESQLG